MRSAVTSDAECALASSLDDDDFDLAGEVLMTWPYLRASWPNSAKFCFSVLESIQHEVGFIPSLSLNMETFSGLSEPGRTHYVLLEAYHTVYVGGLLSVSVPFATALA